MGRPPPLSGLALGRCLAFKSPDLSSSSLRRLLRKKSFFLSDLSPLYAAGL